MFINSHSSNELELMLKEAYATIEEKDKLIHKLIIELKGYQLKEQEERRKAKIKEGLLSGKK